MRNSTKAPSVVKKPPMEEQKKADELLDELAKSNDLDDWEFGDDANSVDEYQKFDMEKVEEVVKNFLEAETLEECKKFVCSPERVWPLIDRYYATVDYEPEGFSSLDKTKSAFRGEFLTLKVTKADFLPSPIGIQRIEEGDEVSYRVDWESWVGYSDYTIEEMRSERPSEPFLVRVVVQEASYYNYSFSDDKIWRSLALEFKDPLYSFLGYVKIDSDLDDKFRQTMKVNPDLPCLLKVAYPEGTRQKDQLEILEFVTTGWIMVDEETDQKDE